MVHNQVERFRVRFPDHQLMNGVVVIHVLRESVSVFIGERAEDFAFHSVKGQLVPHPFRQLAGPGLSIAGILETSLTRLVVRGRIGQARFLQNPQQDEGFVPLWLGGQQEHILRHSAGLFPVVVVHCHDRMGVRHGIDAAQKGGSFAKWEEPRLAGLLRQFVQERIGIERGCYHCSHLLGARPAYHKS